MVISGRIVVGGWFWRKNSRNFLVSAGTIYLFSIERLDLCAHFGGYGDLSRPIQTTLEPHEVAKSPQKRLYRGIENSDFFDKKTTFFVSKMYPDTSKVHENHPAPPCEPIWVHRYIAKKRKYGRVFVFVPKLFETTCKGLPELKFVFEEKSWKSMKVVTQFRYLAMYLCTQMGSHGGAGWSSCTFEVSGYISEHLFSK